MRVASEWSDIEADREVRIPLDCIHGWRKTRQRTRYQNRQVQCSNASFAFYVCHETRIVEKGKALNLQNSFCPHSHLLCGHESWGVTEREQSQVQVSEAWFLRGIEGVTLFNKVRSSEIRKSLNIEPLQTRHLTHITFAN